MADGAAAVGIRRSAAAYATLVRVPNLFTAPPDVILGAALAAGAGLSVSPVALSGLLIASATLYAAGTALNDYFDAPEDAVERPERPIPSGTVPRRRALFLGLALLGGGIVGSGLAAGRSAAAVAALIAASVVLYDGALKGGLAGFLAMGAARGLNVSLGVTAAGAFPTTLPTRALVVPLIVAGYIASVTFMAEYETAVGNRGPVAVGAIGTALAGLAAVGNVAAVRPGAIATGAAVALAGAFLAWTGRALRRAYAHPVPETVGPAVGTCVLGLVVLDAAFAAATGVGWAVVAALFLVPAVGLARAFDVT